MKYVFTEMSENGKLISVKYRVKPGEKVGITGEYTINEKKETVESPRIFFTEEEAGCWCNWLVENKVLPSSLNQILSDELYIL
jgi:hypothetical protein